MGRRARLAMGILPELPLDRREPPPWSIRNPRYARKFGATSLTKGEPRADARSIVADAAQLA
jgi:hypothetical protein